MVEYLDNARLLAAYKRVVPWLLEATHSHPKTVAPHPDHPDRLRVTFWDEKAWAFWVALFEGSTHAAVHEEVNGETEHRWVSADGNLWLLWHGPLAGEDPLAIFDKEDR